MDDIDVGEAALWLDEHWPEGETPWYRVVNTWVLDMDDGCLCIAGQLGAYLASQEGYETGERYIKFSDPTMDVTSTSGWSVLTADLGQLRFSLDHSTGVTRAWCEVELELVTKLFKRLEVEEDGTLPGFVHEAFSGGVPNRLWIEQIDLRRENEGV